jgi:hypothetical protein
MTLKLGFIERGSIAGTPYCRWHYRLSWNTPKAPVPDHYVVQRGDTLWAITRPVSWGSPAMAEDLPFKQERYQKPGSHFPRTVSGDPERHWT